MERSKAKQRDNYHIILLAKNYEGVKEINSLVSMANDDNHMYYKPRISFEEASKISDNVIMVSACLASPLWSWKRTVMDYKAEIESIKAEIIQWQVNKEKFIAELDGETTVRKKKRKPELIEADIQKCDDYLHNLIINTKISLLIWKILHLILIIKKSGLLNFFIVMIILKFNHTLILMTKRI